MLGLGRKRPPLIGIDISSTSVKLVELGGDHPPYRVEAYAVEPLPGNAVVEKNIQEVEAVGEAIQKAYRRSGSRSRHCAMAVPSSAVITKTINMPAGLKPDELESQIQVEADAVAECVQRGQG
ncbi:MAG: pilus assembly protein PilM, partial [Ectothiorhodospira sp.]